MLRVDDFRESLPLESDNFDVYCARCKRVHPFLTMTRERYDKIIADAVENLRRRVDEEALTYVLSRMANARDSHL